jgi:hypothetical protein
MATGVWDGVTAAARFVARLAEAPRELLRPAVPPVLDHEPYLSAWLNVETALGNAPDAERRRLEGLTRELDQALSTLGMDRTMEEAARRAVRALLVRDRVSPPESFTFVYEPFEDTVPLESLMA